MAYKDAIHNKATGMILIHIIVEAVDSARAAFGFGKGIEPQFAPITPLETIAGSLENLSTEGLVQTGKSLNMQINSGLCSLKSIAGIFVYIVKFCKQVNGSKIVVVERHHYSLI